MALQQLAHAGRVVFLCNEGTLVVAGAAQLKPQMSKRNSMAGVLMSVLITVGALWASPVDGRKGFGGGGQEYDYVTVRQGAHLFYWLYYVAGGEAPAGRPLVVWLEGGPGAAASSYGNFGKLGPLDPSARPRNHSWVDKVNILFVDSPVGTGYSYVDTVSALARTSRQTSLDLVELTRQVLDKYPLLRATPLYIFGESFGGSVAAEFALDLSQEIRAGRVSANLKGVVMGDSWLSGVDHVESWAPYLHHLGMLDGRGRALLAAAAARVRAASEEARWQDATSLWSVAWTLMTNLTEGVNIYNVLAPVEADGEKGGKPSVPCASSEMMNGEVHRALGIPDGVVHQNDNGQVFVAQYEQFMKPVTETVECLLKETNISVLVYAGQCDVFTNMAGTMAWLHGLRWPQAAAFGDAERTRLVVDGMLAGFSKRAGSLTALWVHRAGHLVSIDYPEAAMEILRLVTRFDVPTVPTL